MNQTPSRILVVDDHPNAAFILARVLQGLGLNLDIITAHSGEEALLLVGEDPVHIVITDYLMSGMNGLELIEQLIARDCPPPNHTILITAYNTEGLALTAKHLHIDDYVTKPVDPDKLRQIVSKTLDGGKSSRATQFSDLDNKQFTILVADDNPDNVHLLTTRIANEGYRFIVAKDGVEALEKTYSELPDLILLDINMPNKDGFEVLQEIRDNEKTRHLQVLMVTAVRTQPEHIRKGFNLGADDYIVKPIDWHEMNSRIRAKLRVKRAEDSLQRRNRELALLPEIAQDLSARLDIEEIASIVLERTALALNATNSHLALFYPDGSVFQKMFAHGKFVDLQEEVKQQIVEEGLVSFVVPSRQGIIIQDTKTDDRWLKTRHKATRSAVAVPLLGRHDVLGVLTLTHTKPHQFTYDHQNLLQAIGSQVAIAVENAQLYETMEQERRRLAAVLNAVGDAILVTDGRQQLEIMNPAGRRLFSTEVAGLKQPLPTNEDGQQLIELAKDAQITAVSQQAELDWTGKRTFHAQVTPITEGGSVIVMHDITHFKEIERAKNEFLAAASHDLKNPIASMLLSTDLVKRTGPLNERQESLMDRIELAAAQMHQLVKDLLDLAQTDLQINANREEIDLATIITAVHEEFLNQADAKNQTLALRMLAAGQPLIVQGESSRLKQVFRNLVGNAVKYTPENGRITITTESRDNEILIHVEDDGIGIPEDDLPFIFDSFYRVKDENTKYVEGSGLGLAIVKSILDQHGGQIEVRSEVEQGTCFTIILPAVATIVHRVTEVIAEHS